MRRSSSRARIRATQCEKHAGHGRCDERGLIGRAAAGRKSRTPVCRSHRGRRHHGRGRGLRACGRRRPFAFRRGPLGRAHRRPDFPAARGPIAAPRNGCARGSPAPRAVARSSQSRTLRNAGAVHAGRPQQAPGASVDGGPCPPSRSRSIASKAPTVSVSSESRRWANAAAHDGPARARGQYGRMPNGSEKPSPPGSRGARLPRAHRLANGIRVGRGSARGLARYPGAPLRRSRLQSMGRRMRRDAGGGAGCGGNTRDSWDAHRARDAELRRREVGEPNLADRPSLLPCGMERGQGEAGDFPPPPQAGHARPAHASAQMSRRARGPRDAFGR